MKIGWTWLIVVVLGISGCGNPETTGSAPQRIEAASTVRKKVYFLAPIDVSNSSPDADKLTYGGVVIDQMEDLDADSDKLSVFVYDQRVREVASEVPANLDDFKFYLQNAILKPFGDAPRGSNTSQGAALAAVATALKRVDASRYSVRVLMPSDGGFEDRSPGAEKLYRDSVQVIERVPDVEVVYWAVKPGEREDIRARWKHLDSMGKFHIIEKGGEIKW